MPTRMLLSVDWKQMRLEHQSSWMSATSCSWRWEHTKFCVSSLQSFRQWRKIIKCTSGLWCSIILAGSVTPLSCITRRKWFLLVSSDECTLQRPKISEAISEEKEKQKFCKNMLLLSSFSTSLFSLDNHHTLCSCLPSLSTASSLLYINFSLLISHIFLSPVPETLLLSLPSSLSLFLFSFPVAPHPWSILAKLQSLIRPVEAPIWPLISISDLSVRDRVYTGSSLECKAPSPSAVPQTWSHLLPSLPSFAVLATLSLLISLSPQC